MPAASLANLFNAVALNVIVKLPCFLRVRIHIPVPEVVAIVVHMCIVSETGVIVNNYFSNGRLEPIRYHYRLLPANVPDMAHDMYLH